MFIKNLIKRARKEEFIIIYISSELTMNFESNQIIVNTIGNYNPTYWKLLNPVGYYIYYLDNKINEKLSKTLYDTILNLIINDILLSEHKIGISKGTMIAKFSLTGKILEEPLGIVANQAAKSLIGKNQLQT
jgi:hypothetical protein